MLFKPEWHRNNVLHSRLDKPKDDLEHLWQVRQMGHNNSKKNPKKKQIQL